MYIAKYIIYIMLSNAKDFSNSPNSLESISHLLNNSLKEKGIKRKYYACIVFHSPILFFPIFHLWCICLCHFLHLVLLGCFYIGCWLLWPFVFYCLYICGRSASQYHYTTTRSVCMLYCLICCIC